uniref:Uncharacterized protein n=1 Tax=Acrobeloides nanus TaxID=290746 RepID=A0A914BUB2_9BILA
MPNHQKVSAYEDLRKNLKTTVEPMLTYAIEAWYPFQVVLQNAIERVQKFAARLCTNDFILHCSRNYSGSPSTKLQWRNVHWPCTKSHPGPPETIRLSCHAVQRA